MDKVLELYLRSIVRHLSGDIDLSKEYEELALEEYDDYISIARVEEHLPRQIKKRLYEMVS